MRDWWLRMLAREFSEKTEALFSLLEPGMRCDLMVYESCSGMDVSAPKTPTLIVIPGQHDDCAPAHCMSGWKQVGGLVRFTHTEGSHLFVLTHAEALAKVVMHFIEELSRPFP